MKTVLRIALTLLSTAVLVAIAAAGTAYHLNTPSEHISPDGNLFVVPKGAALSQIAASAERHGLIRSRYLLRFVSLARGTEGDVKVGTYKVSPGTSTVAFHDLITSGEQYLLKVTIPEGWTISRIAGLLESKGITQAEAFQRATESQELLDRFAIVGDTAEGFLYPDTYFLPPQMPPEDVAHQLVSTFFQRLDEVASGHEDLAPEQLYRKVIVASIVEREYRIAEEAPLIASVFYNRLRVNMGLESCATVGYILTEIQGRSHPGYLTYEDLRIDSPYNTYKWAGLPPSPISNPGAVALDAAFHAPETDYWYFVLQDPQTGEHFFSKDLQEHNRARYMYLKNVQ
jgi:UPF0755 protein